MAIKLTEAAVKKVNELMKVDKSLPQDVFLRMGVKGGGCSGLSYLLEFDDKELGLNDMLFHEFVVETDGKLGQLYKIIENGRGGESERARMPFTIVIDKKSYLYLNGTTLDYVVQGLTGGFTFINPGAKSTCGCGTSFEA